MAGPEHLAAAAAGSQAEAAALRIVVAADGARRRLLRTLLAEVAPRAQVLAPSDVVDTLLAAARSDCILLVVDHGRAGGAAPALLRQAAQVAPHAAVLAFDDLLITTPAYTVRPWDEARLVLHETLQGLTRPPAGGKPSVPGRDGEPAGGCSAEPSGATAHCGAPLPPDEAQRLGLLHGLQLLDTESDPVLDGLARSAALALGCPIALVSLVDERRQWFKARVGLDAQQTPREQAFCAHAIHGDELFEVADAAGDPRFADNPLVTGDPNIRYYAGVPLQVDGRRLGTLCVIDRRPRRLDAAQRALLNDLARAAEHWLHAWRGQHALSEMRRFVAAVAQQVPGAIFQLRCNAAGQWSLPFVSDGVATLLPLDAARLQGRPELALDALAPADRLALRQALQQSARERVPCSVQLALAGTGRRWLELRAMPQAAPGASDGEIVWHGHVHEVTQRVHAESRQREQLTERRARAAREALLARFSHELRTPLNALLGFAQLMLAEPVLPPPQADYLRLMEDAGLQLLQQIDAILAEAPAGAGAPGAATSAGVQAC